MHKNVSPTVPSEKKISKKTLKYVKKIERIFWGFKFQINNAGFMEERNFVPYFLKNYPRKRGKIFKRGLYCRKDNN